MVITILFDDSKGIIDKIEVSTCNTHDTSDLIEHDWDLTNEDGVSFMIGKSNKIFCPYTS